MNHEKLNDLISDWNNKEKAQAIALLKKSMSDSVTIPRVSSKEVQDYVRDSIVKGLESGKLLDYSINVDTVARNTYYKESIRDVIRITATELNIDVSSNDALKECWKEVEKSKNLIEYRKNIHLYFTVLFSNFYTNEDIQEYVEMIDQQDKEIRQLQEYKRIYNDMFEVITEDDEELGQQKKAKQMKDSGFTDTEICKVLGFNRNRLNYLRRKDSLMEVQC